MTGVAAAVAGVRARIAAAARRAGRDPDSVTLVAVSKRHPTDAIAAAHAAGVRDFGESYAQELADKADRLTELPAIAWHFIGRLQRNKVKLVVGRAALIHAVDSEALVRAIDARAAAAGVIQPILIAVNVGGETHKSGVAPDAAAGLLAVVTACPHVACRGVMTMPPPADEPEDSRPHFRALREVRDRLASEATPLPELSMGMTDDFEVAVEEGATLVRVGTAIFGARDA